MLATSRYVGALNPGRLLLTIAQEFDTPLNLFMQEEGIFRSMCQGSGITQEEVEKASA